MRDDLKAYAQIKFVGFCLAVIVFGMAVVFVIGMATP